MSNVGLPNARVAAAAVPRAILPQPPQPRPRVSAAQTIRPPPHVLVRPVTAPVRGTLNRSTAPAQIFPNPQPAGPAMYVARNARFSQVGSRR